MGKWSKGCLVSMAIGPLLNMSFGLDGFASRAMAIALALKIRTTVNPKPEGLGSDECLEWRLVPRSSLPTFAQQKARPEMSKI